MPISGSNSNGTPILECVPNFSEGKNLKVIAEIAGEIKKIRGVKLLHIDQGYDANRTVITFAGEPEGVVEAAFNSARKAAELIDMRLHKGIHPRFGAIDVMPLIPVRGITMDETVLYARNLAKRIGEELDITIYCYEYAAYVESRKNLAHCRSGEYEGLSVKLSDPHWKPDFGSGFFNARLGALAVGARKFLIAYNVNLNTSDVSIAKRIASIVRESGLIKKVNQGNGELKRMSNPGIFKNLKAIGWYMPRYGKSQVSMNVTDIDTTSLHFVYEEIKKLSQELGIEVTGSELVGLVPLKALLDAGNFYKSVSHFPLFNSEEQLLELAVTRLGLNDVAPFKYKERIIEYLL
jgi:glutamate formiminotransferase / formiminotetrahydrofolate cyclodeaminase